MFTHSFKFTVCFAEQGLKQGHIINSNLLCDDIVSPEK